MKKIKPLQNDLIYSFSELTKKLEESIASAHQKANAIFVLIIEDFGRLHLDYGYQATDLILEQLLQRLETIIRENDYIGRIHQSEYAILLTNTPGTGPAILAANRIKSLIQQPYFIHDKEITLSTRIGIKLITSDTTMNGEKLMQQATLAAHMAREENSEYCFYNERLAIERARTVELEAELIHALENNLLMLYFQPIYNAKTGKIIKAEALARWKNREEFIAPERFVPIATHSPQLFDQFTRFVFNNALRLLSNFNEKKIDITLSINISVNNIVDPDFPNFLQQSLDTWGISPEQLILELTENELFRELSYPISNLDRLYELGFRLSIDDFGTGYSSMDRLKHIPFSELKIDKSFVQNMAKETLDEKIAQTIITLAHAFNNTVVAEGVEDKKTLEKLIELDCDYVQGFYFSKPLPEETFIDFYFKSQPFSKRS